MKTLLIFFTFSVLISAQVEQTGNWWVRQSDYSKVAYISGYIDGMYLGNDLTTIGLDSSQFNVANDSYLTLYNEYIANTSVGQIRDGLNSLYPDYRNRNILIKNALFLVLEAIDGISQAKYEQALEALRRESD